MVQALNRFWTFVPNLAYFQIEGWQAPGSLVTIVEDEGSPAPGDQHCARLIAGKVNENFVKSINISDDGGSVLRLTVSMKFSQRDIYLNENSQHDFFQIWDNNGANLVLSLYYKGIDIDDNEIGVMDQNGVKAVLDSGPFVADIWYTFDGIWQHDSSSSFLLFRNQQFQSQTTGKDFHTTDGEILFKVAGQIKNVAGPSGNSFCSFVAHTVDMQPTFAAFPAVEKHHFRPFEYYGPDAVVDEAGTKPGDALFTGGAERLWDNAVSNSGYRPPSVGNPRGGAWPSNRFIDLAGPCSRFAEGAVAVAATVCAWHAPTIKGGDDNDPWILYGKANSDLTSFTIEEFNVPRGVNIKSQLLLLPASAGFPGIGEYAMLGLLHKANQVSTFLVEEILMTYLVESPAPPRTQIQWLGDTVAEGDLQIA